MKKELLFILSFFLSYLSNSQEIPNYFELNENYYEIKDSLNYDILKYFLQSAERCLREVDEHNLKQTSDTSFRIIFLSLDTIENYSFVSRIWGKDGVYHKRDIVFTIFDVVDRDSYYYEVSKIILDTTYVISKKKFYKFFKKISPEIFNNSSDVQQMLLLNTIYESKDTTYRCLYFHSDKMRLYGKEISHIYFKLKPNVQTEYEKRQKRMQNLMSYLIIILGSILSALL